jgi:hypothetical protein
MKKFKYLLISIPISLLLSGCNLKKSEDDSKLSLIKATNPNPVQITNKNDPKIADHIKQDVMEFDEIYDVAVIRGKKDTIVVYKVKHLKRFQMEKIEAKISNSLEKNYPNEKFTISSDFKIFMEALELKKKVDDPNYSQEKAEKELQKIIKLKQEMT